MLKDLFKTEKANLDYFFDNIDYEMAEKFLNILKECQGLIIITGVGKSGLVAEKIAVTLTSIGCRALFLSPSNAMHGDIGIVNKEDVFLMISKSGESEELLHMIPYLRNKGVKLLAIVNKGCSRLTKAVDLSIVLKIEKELCPFDLVPTTSSLTQLIFGDVLSVALMKVKNFGLTDYAENHPAGKIGRILTVRVSDLMLKNQDVPLCHPEDKLVDILVELSNKKCGCILIVDKTMKFKGIFTDGDLRRALQKLGSLALELTMQEIMTKTARYIESTEMANTALKMMESDQKNPITVLPVVDKENTIVGLIKIHDIINSGF